MSQVSFDPDMAAAIFVLDPTSEDGRTTVPRVLVDSTT